MIKYSYTVGHRDIVYHIEVSKKYVYIYREQNKKFWRHVAYIPICLVRDPKNISFKEADRLYFSDI